MRDCGRGRDPQMARRFYLTTAIDYVNNRPHLGTAYEKIAADVIARFHRLAGDDVRFVMGNDEHSQNVYRRARELGLEPLAYCDRMEAEFRAVWAHLQISFDDFIRTSEPRHRSGVTEVARRIHEAGDVYEGVYEGWYCVGCEAFKPEKDLVDGCCPLHPTTKPQWIREKNYFFRLSKYQQALLEHFARHPDFMLPDIRRNEILRLIESGLEDISISRAGQSWGIPLPFDPASVVYVWFDALINYASAVGLGQDEALFERWWPAQLHVVGKDITRFHGVIWPAMLMSAQLPVPRQVFGHGFMSYDGQRMSKSLGTAIDPVEAANKLGVDPLRWYLTREIVFGQDGDFSWPLFEKTYNADLANNLGNLVNRVVSMAHRYRGGVLRGPGTARSIADAFSREAEAYRPAFDSHHLSMAAGAAMRYADAANDLITRREPWKLAKTNEDAALDACLWDAGEALRLAAVLLSPFMPTSSAEILRRLGVGHDVGRLRLAGDGEWQPDGERSTAQGPLLWPRVEADAPVTLSTKETAVTDETPSAPVNASVPPPAPAPAAEVASAWPLDQRITIDDFMKVDLRVAKVLTAERVPNSRKLVKMTIDVGNEQRTLVAGIAEAYEADALVGRHVVIVANLKPAKLMGIESNGMVLAASPDGGKPVLLGFDNAPAPGTRVR